jgi:hypothetical protein
MLAERGLADPLSRVHPTPLHARTRKLREWWFIHHFPADGVVTATTGGAEGPEAKRLP